MIRRTKIALVIAGYGLAVLTAVVAGWLYDVRVAGLPYDTSGGGSDGSGARELPY